MRVGERRDRGRARRLPVAAGLKPENKGHRAGSRRRRARESARRCRGGQRSTTPRARDSLRTASARAGGVAHQCAGAAAASRRLGVVAPRHRARRREAAREQPYSVAVGGGRGGGGAGGVSELPADAARALADAQANVRSRRLTLPFAKTLAAAEAARAARQRETRAARPRQRPQ